MTRVTLARAGCVANGAAGRAARSPVIGLHKRGENVYLSVVKNCSNAELMPIITGRVLEGPDICTDGWKACDGLVLAVPEAFADGAVAAVLGKSR